MRVNPNCTSDIMAALWRTKEQENTALQQISTGKRVNVPSDDPSAAATYTGNVAKESDIDQYQSNIGALKSLYGTADSALSSVVTALNQAISLGTEGANGTMNTGNLNQITTSVQAILDHVIQLANTSFEGNYIFAGSATSTKPFVEAGGAVTYKGDTTINSVEIAEGLSVDTNVPGSQLFEQAGSSVMGSMEELIAALQSGDTANIATATTDVGTALNYLSSQRTFYGNSLNQLSSNDSSLAQQKLDFQSQDTTLIGIDLAQAATDLSQAQTAYQATLAASSKVLQSTLLDYLK